MEKAQAELTALRVTYEKKDEEFQQLDQSLSQSNIRLVITENELTQATDELMMYKEKIQELTATQVISYIGS